MYHFIFTIAEPRLYLFQSKKSTIFGTSKKNTMYLWREVFISLNSYVHMYSFNFYEIKVEVSLIYLCTWKLQMFFLSRISLFKGENSFVDLD